MRNINEEVLILQLRPLKEATKLLICFSRGNGKLKLIVKGASKTLSKNAPSLDPGNHVKIQYYKSKSEFDLLLQTNIVSSYSNLKASGLGIATIFYIIEILNFFTIEDASQEDLFVLVIDILDYLEENLDRVLPTLAYFQIRCLEIFGFEPDLLNCSICNEPFKLGKPRKNIIQSNSLGYVCENHFDVKDDSDLVEDTILKVQKYLRKKDFSELDIIKLTEEQWLKILTIQNNWIQSVIEKEIKSYRMILNG